jgi:hypothetical protein
MRTSPSPSPIFCHAIIERPLPGPLLRRYVEIGNHPLFMIPLVSLFPRVDSCLIFHHHNGFIRLKPIDWRYANICGSSRLDNLQQVYYGFDISQVFRHRKRPDWALDRFAFRSHGAPLTFSRCLITSKLYRSIRYSPRPPNYQTLYSPEILQLQWFCADTLPASGVWRSGRQNARFSVDTSDEVNLAWIWAYATTAKAMKAASAWEKRLRYPL